jgi:hypothetical protein
MRDAKLPAAHPVNGERIRVVQDGTDFVEGHAPCPLPLSAHPATSEKHKGDFRLHHPSLGKEGLHQAFRQGDAPSFCAVRRRPEQAAIDIRLI